MKILLLTCLILFSITMYAQDSEAIEEETNPKVEVVEEVASDVEVIEEETPADAEVVEEEPVSNEEVVTEEITPQEEVISNEVIEGDIETETTSKPEPVNVNETASSADIKAKFRNIKTLTSQQEEEVKIDIRKPDDSSIMPRKETDFEYLQKRDMEDKLKKSNRMLY